MRAAETALPNSTCCTITRVLGKTNSGAGVISLGGKISRTSVKSCHLVVPNWLLESSSYTATRMRQFDHLKSMMTCAGYTMMPVK